MKQEAPLLISASMIVRDEEANLSSCLASLTGLVDEVVLYDTGSADRTIAVAKDLAGQFGLDLNAVEGYWDDDFSRARNASLALAKGEWILVVDADETVECEDPEALREQLAAALVAQPGSKDDVDGLQVFCRNIPAASWISTESWVSMRVFRRERCRWRGRLHETPVTLDGGEFPRSIATDTVAIVHSGHSHANVRNREKAERNLRIARADVERSGDSAPSATSLTKLARSLVYARRPVEALKVFEDALASGQASQIEKRHAYAAIAQIQGNLGHFESAESALKGLWHVSNLPTLPSYLDATLGLHQSSAFDPSSLGRSAPEDDSARGRLNRVVDRIARLGHHPTDDTGSLCGPDKTSPVAAQALVALGRHDEAAALVLDTASQGFFGVDLPFVISCFAECSTPISALAEAIAPWLLKPVLAQASQLPVDDADAVFEALFQRFSEEESIAALATLCLGGSLTAQRLSLWTQRLGRLQEAGALATGTAGPGSQ